VPLRYVLEIGELAVVVVFLTYGLWEAVGVFRKHIQQPKRKNSPEDES